MLRLILCIVFVLSANCLPVQSQDQERSMVSLRVGFAPDRPLMTFPLVPEGAEVTFSSRIQGTLHSFRFTPIIGEDSEVIVTFSDLDGNPMGAVTLQQTDECEVIETETSPPIWIGIVTDECEVTETGGFQIGVERD